MQDLEKLKKILKDLRNPDTGCPWDRVQTFASIAPNTVEEAYEVLYAVETEDYENLKEEIGDLLLHVLFYSDMAAEQEKFSFEDVVDALCQKLIARHPHVFGQADRANNPKEALESWEKMKSKERIEKKKMPSALDGIVETLPAMVRSQKIQKRLAREGFNIRDSKRAFGILREKVKKAEYSSQSNVENALGSVLFAAINVARKLNLDAENLLRKYNKNFETRYRKFEKEVAKTGKTIDTLPQKEIIRIWDETK